jgi:hypothetical protein
MGGKNLFGINLWIFLLIRISHKASKKTGLLKSESNPLNISLSIDYLRVEYFYKW